MATDAADRIKVPDRLGGQQQALIAIVFSVAALEAFLNEAAELAGDPYWDHEAISTFADIMADVERFRLEAKLVLAGWIFSGKRLDKGQQPYQDFNLLIELRNSLIHYKPNPSIPDTSTPEQIRHALTEKFRSKNILADDEDPKLQPYSWIYRFQTKAIANWSCRTAALMVKDLVSQTPAETQWHEILKQL